MPSVSLMCGRTRWPTCPVGLPRPVGGSLQDLEAIARQQVRGDAGPLGVGERAHGVHEHAPRLQEADGRVHDRPLHRRQALRGGGIDPPPRVGPAPQGPEPGARCVDRGRGRTSRGAGAVERRPRR